MARWITIKLTAVPFDYRWPEAVAITAFTEAGEFFVKDEVADYAIGRGFATDGRKKSSTARSVKSGPKARTTVARKSAKVEAYGETPDLRSDVGMVRADIPAPDRPRRRRAVDSAAG